MWLQPVKTLLTYYRVKPGRVAGASQEEYTFNNKIRATCLTINLNDRGYSTLVDDTVLAAAVFSAVGLQTWYSAFAPRASEGFGS